MTNLSPPNGELDTIVVPTRPILDELIRTDHGAKLFAAQGTERWQMLQDGLCGLLYPDNGHLSPEQRGAFDCEIGSYRNKMHLTMLAPQSVLENASLDRLSSTGTSIVAGLIYAPEHVKHTRELVQTILNRSDVVDRNPEKEEIAIVFQGGARISDDEYHFAKQVGAHISRNQHAPKKFITGGGRGIMRAPHSGAFEASMEDGFNDTKSCGISCGKIIAAEPPNKLIKHLAVFEEIERRLEAFTRSGQMTVLFPGGTGTFEELLYLLAVLLEAKNRDIYYSFLMVGSEENREHYDVILRTLEEALGKKTIKESGLRERICIGKPPVVARHILKEVNAAQKMRRAEIVKNDSEKNIRMDFHGGIHIPSGLREPFKVTRESVAALQLDRNQSPTDTIVNLRRFVYTVTLACVSTERQEVERNGPFQVSGDSNMTHAVDGLMRFFAANGRMNGGEYKQPYELVTSAV